MTRALVNPGICGMTVTIEVAEVSLELSVYPNIMGKFELPKLPYAYDALEPSIDKMTMEIHHTKHHNTYVTKLNGAVEGTDLEGKSLDDLITNVSKHSAAVRNNGGGHFNHTLFWTVMGPGGGKPEGALADAINSSFNSFDEFKTKFYKLQGWDTTTGYPTRSALEPIGLGYVADELEKEGKLGKG